MTDYISLEVMTTLEEMIIVKEIMCWSTSVTDLSDWKYEGVIYRKKQHPFEIGTGNLYAPDVALGPDGRYYLYYSVADSSIISVAVCDKPAGQYKYYGDLRDTSGHVIDRR